MPPLIQALMIFVPFLIIVAACSLYFSGYPERQARVRHWLAGTAPHMSSSGAAPPSREAADPGVNQPIESASAPTVMPSSAVSDELTADEVAAQAIALLLNAGLLTNRTKAIEKVFHCSVTAKSRPDTPYQRALKLVELYQAPARPEYRPLDDEHRTALQLDQR